MKIFLPLCAALLLFAQTPLAAAPPQEEPMLAPGIMPLFKGDDQYKFVQWVNDWIIYPKKAENENIEGRVVVTFIIEKDGMLTGAEILSSPDSLLSKEVIRVLNRSPKWQPGALNGVDVRTRLTLPITFVLRHEPQFPSTDGRKVDVMPRFKGGDVDLFRRWVIDKMLYVSLPEGTATMSFVVDETGRVKDVKVVDTFNKNFSDQLLRGIQKSPRWKPGLIDGKPVSVAFTLPIIIDLNWR